MSRVVYSVREFSTVSVVYVRVYLVPATIYLVLGKQSSVLCVEFLFSVQFLKYSARGVA